MIFRFNLDQVSEYFSIEINQTPPTIDPHILNLWPTVNPSDDCIDANVNGKRATKAIAVDLYHRVSDAYE